MKRKITMLLCCTIMTISIITGCKNNKKEISSKSLNPCEVQDCLKDGTNEIVGLSSKTEYYCDEHYKAMGDIVQKMLDDNDNIDFSENNKKIQENSDKSKIISREQKSKVYQAYTTAINLTKKQLTKTNNGYSYNGLDLLSEDYEWIDSKLNKKGTINQGAIYRKMAKLLHGFEMNIADYTHFSEMLIGFIPETRDDFIPYAKNAMTFITEENVIQNIMMKFESLDCVEGSFDYKSNKLGKYSFEIQDLTKCAEEMQISEEMLGYIFAMLDEYAPKIELNSNKCSFNYSNISKSNKPKKLSEKDFVAEYEGKKLDILKILDKEGEGYFQYFAFDAAVDESKESIIRTDRGIHIGNSRKRVIKRYGKAKENQVDLEKDGMYQAFLYEGMNTLANLMKNQCNSYILYTYNDKSIKFYFNESNKVSWIVFLN